MSPARPWLIAAAVGWALAVAWAAGLPELLRWDTLSAHQQDWRAWIARHEAVAGLLYVAVYAAAVGVSIPGGGLFTVAGGLLFGTAAGAMLAVTGASLGAVMLFLLARGTLGALLAGRAGPLLDRVRPALERDGFWALLALRLLPVVPFWLGNLAPALVGMRLAPFAAATVLGIIPATTILAGLGAGVADVLAAGRRPDLSLLSSPGVVLPLLGLAGLSLLPILLRRVRGVRGAA